VQALHPEPGVERLKRGDQPVERGISALRSFSSYFWVKALSLGQSRQLLAALALTGRKAALRPRIA
jgi:hypothetical protein